MATQSVSISAAVGTRNGIRPLPNLPADLTKVTNLFDRIKNEKGGTAGSAILWPSDRKALITQITAQIRSFQTINALQTVDSAIDPNGTTLRLMNQLSDDAPLVASVESPSGDFDLDAVSFTKYYASFDSLAGTKPLVPAFAKVEFSRRLVSVAGSSIKWFGVVVPSSLIGSPASAVPLIFFTPTPNQHPASDPDNDSFTGGWPSLWDDYTSRIGGLLCAAGVKQILVLPFYKSAQAGNLGSFLLNWKDVVSAAITAALVDIDPFCLRDTYTFSTIYSASFSNGVGVHRRFNSGAAGAQAMTARVFDLDGQAQLGGSNWHPTNGVEYANIAPPGMNPRGSTWFVGGRWSLFDKIQPQTSQFSHHACSQFLLAHGLSQFSN
jgi:hypothetical protein